MLTALVFALIITSAVVVHELAHYLNARSVGVPVRAFSVGLGPVLWRRRWRGTEWRLSLLPLGGYVDLPGMAPKVDDEGNLSHPDEGMATKSLPAKLWVLVGGIVANFLLGVVLLTWAVQLEPSFRELTAGVPAEPVGSRVMAVQEGSRAAELGLQPGDTVLAVNDIRDPTPDELIEQVRSTEGELLLQVERDGRPLRFATPWPPELQAGEQPLLGVSVGAREVNAERVSVWQSLGESSVFAVRMLPQMVGGFVRGFGSALSGRQSEEVAGPVGMVTMVGQATRVGLAPVLLLAAVINFSLAVFNLLPIPGLDGGRMLLALVVGLRGRPFRPGQEETLHFLGIMAVLALIVLITFNELSGLLRS